MKNIEYVDHSSPRSALRLRPVLVFGLLAAAAAGAAETNTPIVIREYKPGVVYATNDIVARVNGWTMTWGQVEARARNYLKDEVDSGTLTTSPGGEEQSLVLFRRKAITLFVNKEVLLAEARRRGLEVSASERQKFVADMETVLKERNIAPSLEVFFQKAPLGEGETRREFEDGLIVDKLIRTAVRDKVTLTEADREALQAFLESVRAQARVETVFEDLLVGEKVP